MFQRDMLMNLPLIADLDAIRDRRQQRIDGNLIKSNNKRVDYNYQVGEMVKVKVWDPAKMEARFKGPYQIMQTLTNGTVKLQTGPGITTPYNIRNPKTCVVCYTI